MPCPLRARLRHALVALVAISAFLIAPAVAAEIFKCVAKDGSPLYQNFPCDLDWLGWSPLSPPAVKTLSNAPVAKTPAMPGVAGQEKPKTPPINAASTDKSTHTGELRIGMSSDEVRALLGEPEEMVDDEPDEGGRVSNWRYADGRIVQFDRKHRVVEVKR
jgi:hypothetical protein